MSQGDQASFISTRSKAKLKLIVETKGFSPPHRSTEQLESNATESPQPTGSALLSPLIDLASNINTPSTTDRRAAQYLNEHFNIPVNNHTPTTRTMANTTLRESIAAEKTPATPKFLCPATYNPCTDDAVQFLKQYDRTSAANGWNNTLKITYLPTFLEGAANHWFERYKEEDENNTKTWPDIRKDFLDEFGPVNTKTALEGQLYSRKQKSNEGIREYYYNLLEMFGEYDPTLNLLEFKKFFEHGMSKDLYTHYRLIMDDEPDWRTFRKCVTKLEDIAVHMPLQKSGTCSCHCQHATRPPSQGNYRPSWPQRQNQAWQDNRYRLNSQLDAPRWVTNRPPAPRYGANYRRDPPRWEQNNGAQARFNSSRGNQPQVHESGPRPYRDSTEGWNSPHREQPERPGNWNPRDGSRDTRNRDGRPRCYKCNKIGHHPAVCQSSLRTNPNYGGRHTQPHMSSYQ